MDPFTTDPELLNLHSHFHQGQYSQVISYDLTSIPSTSQSSGRILVLRARIALGEAAEVLSEVKGEKTAELKAVAALAQYTLGKEDDAVKTIEKLAASEEDSEDGVVQVLGGLVLQGVGRSEEALMLLGKHQGNLEAVALIVQIQLQLNRLDLAVKEVAAARRWANDSLLVNLAESWVGLRVGGDKYQQAFYVFEELAQATATTSPLSLTSQGVAELHLLRYDEASAALESALEKEPEHADALANLIVLLALTGEAYEERLGALKQADAGHPLLVGIQEKSDLFDRAAAKFSAKVAA